jgi:8-oxo-dGTP diphosphatase
MTPLIEWPPLYPITGAAADERQWWQSFEKLAGKGYPLIQLRPGEGAPADLRQAVIRARATCASAGVALVLNGPPELALDLGLAGVHLSAARLARCRARPVAHDSLFGASCHNSLELEMARHLGVDYAFLSPVCRTASHPQARPLGWQRFERLVREAQLPVYALGGVGPADLECARAAGATGVAGISAYWN